MFLQNSYDDIWEVLGTAWNNVPEEEKKAIEKIWDLLGYLGEDLLNKVNLREFNFSLFTAKPFFIDTNIYFDIYHEDLIQSIDGRSYYISIPQLIGETIISGLSAGQILLEDFSLHEKNSERPSDYNFSQKLNRTYILFNKKFNLLEKRLNLPEVKPDAPEGGYGYNYASNYGEGL